MVETPVRIRELPETSSPSPLARIPLDGVVTEQATLEKIVGSVAVMRAGDRLEGLLLAPTIHFGSDDNQNFDLMPKLGGSDPENNPEGVYYMLDGFDLFETHMPSRYNGVYELAAYSRASQGGCYPQPGTNRALCSVTVGGSTLSAEGYGWFDQIVGPGPVGHLISIGGQTLRCIGFARETSVGAGYIDVAKPNGSAFTFSAPEYNGSRKVSWQSGFVWGRTVSDVEPYGGSGSIVIRVKGPKLPNFLINATMKINGVSVTPVSVNWNPETYDTYVIISETIPSTVNAIVEWSYQYNHVPLATVNVHGHNGRGGGEENWYMSSCGWGGLLGVGGAGNGMDKPMIIAAGLLARHGLANNPGTNHPSRHESQFVDMVMIDPIDATISLGGLKNEEALRVLYGYMTPNRVEIAGGATGQGPSIRFRNEAGGNVSGLYDTQGDGSHIFSIGKYAGRALEIGGTSNAKNYFKIVGQILGNAPELVALSTDPTVLNLDVSIVPKGTGMLATKNGVMIDGSKVLAPRAAGWSLPATGSRAALVSGTSTLTDVIGVVNQLIRDLHSSGGRHALLAA